MATTVYKPVHETTETTNNGKVTGTTEVNTLCMLMNILKHSSII